MVDGVGPSLPVPARPLPENLKREETLRVDASRVRRIADYVATAILRLPSAEDMPSFAFARRGGANTDGLSAGDAVVASSFRPGAIQGLLRSHPVLCDMYVSLVREEIGPALLDAAFGTSLRPASAAPNDDDERWSAKPREGSDAVEVPETVTLLYQFPPTLRVKEPRGVPPAESGRIDPLKALTIVEDAGRAKGKVPENALRVHSDDMYGHQDGEVNFWLPLTPLDDGGDNTLWAESTPSAGDWHPFAPLKIGDVKRFWGSRVRHFALDNATVRGARRTRVSMDFRCCVREHFDSEWRVPGVVYEHERRAMRFARRRGGGVGGRGEDTIKSWVCMSE